MDSELVKYLKFCKLFSTLDDTVLANIAKKITSIELHANEVLFYQGAPSNDVFILIHGELVAILTMADNSTRILGHIEPGETAGELGALTGEPRSLTIKASKDCFLLKFSSKDFVEICYLHPAVMYASVHPIISRSESILQMMSFEKSVQHIVLAPINKHISLLEPFAERFLEHSAKFQSLTVISDFNPEFNDPSLDADTLAAKINEQTTLRRKSKKIIYLLKSLSGPLAKIGFKKADQLYLIADDQTNPKIDHALLDRIESRNTHFKSYPELILLHEEKTQRPKNTINWLDQTTFHLHHHIRLALKKDYSRLLRFIRGKAVGLVLGGGGTRGWAHLGAIKALNEEKIPIDMIGGTSVGAIVGASYALTESYDETYQHFQFINEQSKNSISWRSLTWPIVSLFDAKNFTQSQIDTFQDHRIEDMWLPFFCISSNLANYAEYVHLRGLIWEKTRASSSLPGLIPPMIINGELHLDGGLLNNLPVDVMRQYVSKHGKVIAVELNSSIGDRRHYQFPPIFTFKKAFLSRLNKNNDHYRLPRLLDTFMRGILIGSSAKTRQNSLVANILVNANLNKFRLLNSNKKQVDKMIEIGYLEMKEQLQRKKEDRD